MTWRDRHVLVAGARRTGISVVDVLLFLGARVTVADGDPAQLDTLGDRPVARTRELAALPAGCDLVVTSPGFRTDSPLALAARDASVPMIGEPELAFLLGGEPEVCPDGPPRWLAVTGTNGKTTTTTMLEAILRAAGVDAVACGNIGLPVVDALRAGHPVLAVELSSFQLEWSPSVRPYAGALLNLAEDHLDWHGSMAAYGAAKARVLRGEVAVGGLDDREAAALLLAAPAPRHVGFTRGAPGPGELGIVDGRLVDRAFGDRVPLAEVADVAPPGPPGEANALAAAALARAHGVPPEAVAAGLRAVAPGAHRGAVVAEAGGVRWVDDSKATNPHAAAASLAGHDRVVWVAGGLLKGADVTDLVVAHRGRLAGAVVLGRDRDAVAAALARHAPEVPVRDVGGGDDGPVSDRASDTASESMLRAARAAAGLAQPGDTVLLAPAAASMDMFRDYAARGDAFAAAARTVAGGAGPRGAAVPDEAPSPTGGGAA
ncbi:UDP-N-acetylmuramoylalanine--D-glutamate ligase [Actinomycetospora sp. NBRC 106375]|uniref:UDP-N-acetylmuramoyl-L-alanine--D-glutamate ligase n=1 Tax=Actinomycetospora sp. NBRC 106375 TaxID=3032207 RepID=UPI0024A1C059|nr:UDP-N-acetylmuramoyl-L-alanine--D-glutamate ligase [Actinomycetospora sp. NBRC 106375]GLZ47371.1 UDP-N-acetylmuramoylalanine--D-glutamate ligase [Actinomycetospora sp. NBRC 106375]